MVWAKASAFTVSRSLGILLSNSHSCSFHCSIDSTDSGSGNTGSTAAHTAGTGLDIAGCRPVLQLGAECRFGCSSHSCHSCRSYN